MWRPRLAWAMFGLTVVCVVAQTLILADQRSLLSRRTIENGWPIISVACVIGALFGALIVARYPRHRIGWLLAVGQLATAVGILADAFAGHILTGHGWGSRALGHWAEWFSSFVNATPALAFVAAIFLLAPDGHLLSSRWRPALWLVGLALVLNTAGVLATDPMAFTYTGETHLQHRFHHPDQHRGLLRRGRHPGRRRIAGATVAPRRGRGTAAAALDRGVGDLHGGGPGRHSHAGRPDRRGRVLLAQSSRCCSSWPTRACRSAPASPSSGTGSTTST